MRFGYNFVFVLLFFSLSLWFAVALFELLDVRPRGHRVLCGLVAFGRLFLITLLILLSRCLILHAQPLRRAVRGRDCDLPRSAAISAGEIALSSLEIAGDRNLDPGPRV